MLAKPAGNQRSSFRCQFNAAHAAAVRMIVARDEAFSNQAIVVVSPLSNASHWETVENRCDVCAKANGIRLLPFRAIRR
jgi:hypothetical protein